MIHDIENIKENIDFLRQVVLGSSESVLGDGRAFISAGLIFGVAGVASSIVELARIGSGSLTGNIFELATGLFLLLAVIQRIRASREGPAVPSTLARIARFARYGMGLALLNLCLCIGLFSHWQPSLLPLVPVIVFSIYGGVWLAAAGVIPSRWPMWVAVLSYLTALLLAVVGPSPWQLFGFGTGMLALAFVPGLVVRRSFNRSWSD